MTTRVTVDAHAGWDIEVVTLNGEPNYPKTATVHIVKANEKHDFYIHSGMTILSIKELPRT